MTRAPIFSAFHCLNSLSPNSTWLVTSCHASRVELCCSTSSTQPKCMGLTRWTFWDMMWRAKWNLGFVELCDMIVIEFWKRQKVKRYNTLLLCHRQCECAAYRPLSTPARTRLWNCNQMSIRSTCLPLNGVGWKSLFTKFCGIEQHKCKELNGK